MCNFDKKFQANLDYWIYDRSKRNKAETIELLQKTLRYGVNEPDKVLLDVARSLQKLEYISEAEFQKNMDIYPFQRRYSEKLNEYSEDVQISREFFLEDINHKRIENYEMECECF